MRSLFLLLSTKVVLTTMAVSSEDVPLLTACGEDEELDEDDRFILQVQAERRDRQERQLQLNSLHLDTLKIPDGKSHHVFISHSNQSESESSWVTHLVNKLEHDCGLSCFWPQRDFIPGQGVGNQIQKGILGAMKIVIVMTPDSVKSSWCKYETELAFGQSIDSPENNIIPVLLAQCEVPNLLKTMNYIDVPKGEDYVYRIRRSFDEDSRDMAELNPRIHLFKRNTDEPESGRHVEMSAYRNRQHICRGPSWSFWDLTPHERYMLRQAGGKFSEKVYFDARNIANSASALKYYSIFNLSKHCCPLGCGLVIITVFLVVLLLNLVEIIKEELIVVNVWIFLAAVIFLCFGIAFSMCLFNKWNANKLKKQLIRYSLDQVLETKILVAFFEGCNSSPKLVLAYYDLKPCLEYFAGIMGEEENSDGERKEAIAERAKRHLFSLLRANYTLFVKGKLPMSVVHRHPTYLRQKCLCEFAQEILWKMKVV